MKSSTKRSLVIGSGLVVALGVSGAIFAGCSTDVKGEEGTKPASSQEAVEGKPSKSVEKKETQTTKQKPAKVSPSALPKELTESAAPKKPAPEAAEPDKALTDRKASDDKVTGEYKAAAVLINKYSIIYNGQFQYLLELRMTNDNGSKVVNYYSTKNSYDTASIGDTYKVTYAGDSDGNLAIKTISQ